MQQNAHIWASHAQMCVHFGFSHAWPSNQMRSIEMTENVEPLWAPEIPLAHPGCRRAWMDSLLSAHRAAAPSPPDLRNALKALMAHPVVPPVRPKAFCRYARASLGLDRVTADAVWSAVDAAKRGWLGWKREADAVLTATAAGELGLKWKVLRTALLERYMETHPLAAAKGGGGSGGGEAEEAEGGVEGSGAAVGLQGEAEVMGLQAELRAAARKQMPASYWSKNGKRVAFPAAPPQSKAQVKKSTLKALPKQPQAQPVAAVAPEPYERSRGGKKRKAVACNIADSPPPSHKKQKAAAAAAAAETAAAAVARGAAAFPVKGGEKKKPQGPCGGDGARGRGSRGGAGAGARCGSGSGSVEQVLHGARPAPRGGARGKAGPGRQARGAGGGRGGCRDGGTPGTPG